MVLEGSANMEDKIEALVAFGPISFVWGPDLLPPVSDNGAAKEERRAAWEGMPFCSGFDWKPEQPSRTPGAAESDSDGHSMGRMPLGRHDKTFMYWLRPGGSIPPNIGRGGGGDGCRRAASAACRRNLIRSSFPPAPDPPPSNLAPSSLRH